MIKSETIDLDEGTVKKPLREETWRCVELLKKRNGGLNDSVD